MRKFLKSAIEYLAKDLDLDKELLEQIQYVVIVLTFEFIKCNSNCWNTWIFQRELNSNS